jgi:hypothetical protein
MVNFWQIHVPKTGGVSLNSYAIEHGLNWYCGGGHIGFSKKLYDILHPKIILTVLRCPVEQTRSFYGYLNKHNGTNQNFSDWLRNPETGYFGERWEKVWFPNFYVSYFGKEECDDSPGVFDVAVNTLKIMDYVFDTATLDYNFNKMLTKYNFPTFNLVLNTSNKPEINKDDIDFIIKNRSADFELCKMFDIQTNYK